MKNQIAYIAGIFGIIFLILAVVYFITPARSLPHFLPGHSLELVRKHYKHGVAALFLSLCSFAVAWFTSAPKSSV